VAASRLAAASDLRPTGDGDSLASTRLALVLAVAISTSTWSAAPIKFECPGAIMTGTVTTSVASFEKISNVSEWK